jgi:protein TonB
MKHSPLRSRVLVWALAVSLGLHLAVVVAVHRVRPVMAAPERLPTRVVIIRIVTPPPTPRPTPAPQRPMQRVTAPRAAAPHHNVHPAVKAPHAGSTIAQEPSEPALPADTGTQTGTAAPSAVPGSPHPACSTPDTPARVLEAVTPNAPDDDVSNLPATAAVAVTIDPNGRVTDAHIYRSTSDMRLDRAALIAARTTTYAPALINCEPAGGTYLFRADFAP